MAAGGSFVQLALCYMLLLCSISSFANGLRTASGIRICMRYSSVGNGNKGKYSFLRPRERETNNVFTKWDPLALRPRRLGPASFLRIQFFACVLLLREINYTCPRGRNKLCSRSGTPWPYGRTVWVFALSGNSFFLNFISSPLFPPPKHKPKSLPVFSSLHCE